MNTNSKSAMGGEPLDPQLVHKSNIDNILVSNLRRPLPLRVDAEDFESKIFPCCSASEKFLLEEFYTHIPINSSMGEYRLNGVIFTFPTEEAKTKLLNRNLTKKDIRFFLSHYDKNPDGSGYHIKDNPHEDDLARLAKITRSPKALIPDQTKAEISGILDKYGVISQPSLFYANMIIDTSHYYFFEHANDHVPGMMMVEAVRQLLVACTHEYGNIPLSGYNFILSSLAGTFKSYLELNYPVSLKVIHTNLHAQDPKMWTNPEFEVHVHQNEKENAVLNFQAKIVRSKLFQRLRNAKYDDSNAPWFVLRDNVEHRAIIRGNGLPKIDAQIHRLSHDGCIFVIATEIDTTKITAEEVIEFFIYFSKVGFIHGTAALKSENKREKHSLIHINFKEMEKSDKTNLQEAIKKYGYLAEEELLHASGG